MNVSLSPNTIELQPFVRSVLLVLLRFWGTELDVQDIIHHLIGMGWEHDSAMPDLIRQSLDEIERAITR